MKCSEALAALKPKMQLLKTRIGPLNHGGYGVVRFVKANKL